MLAGMFFVRGVAPPSSRKLIDTPTLPPRFDDKRAPEKYGRRLTAVPLYMPLARIPGTPLPTVTGESAMGSVKLAIDRFIESDG